MRFTEASSTVAHSSDEDSSSSNTAKGVLNAWAAKIGPYETVINACGIRPHVVTTQNALAVVQPKLPVVPVAGQNAVVVHRTFGQRIAFVRVTVIDRKDVAVGFEDSQLTRPTADNSRFGFDVGDRDEAFPGHGLSRTD